MKKQNLLAMLMCASLIGLTGVTAAAKDQANTSSGGGSDAFTTIMSTKFDFGETGIEGTMKAPDGFFLQGKQSQSLSQMVRLRSSFKRELRNSRSGVQGLSR